MKKEDRYLDISIFYEKSHWHQILVDCIYPYVKSNSDTVGYILKLGRTRGEHIQITLRVPERMAKEVATNFDEYIKKYLLEKPSPSKEEITYPQGLFLDFNNNSVHYGVNEPTRFKMESNSFRDYLEGLSSIIILVFRDYGHDTFSYYTEIILQLFSVYSQVIPKNALDAIETFDLLLSDELENVNREAQSRIVLINEQNFENNKNDLLSLISLDSDIKTRPWMKEWKNTLMSFLENNGRHELDRFQQKYLITLLCDAFDFEDRITAYFLFRNTLKWSNGLDNNRDIYV